MNKCSVCKKEIPEGATECSLICNQEASQRFRAGPAADARSTFASAMRRMLQPKPRELQPQVEVPMILVKHRWLKNRNIVAGSVVISFDTDGVAKVPDVGGNRNAVEIYCRFSKGLAKIVEPAKEEVQEAPVVGEKVEKKAEKPAEKPIEPPPPPMKEKIEDDDIVTSSVEEEDNLSSANYSKKKPPKKKKIFGGKKG